MASLTILSIQELNTVVEKAKNLRNVTPFSFRILVNEIGFLIKNNKNLKQNYEKYKPLSLLAMPIFPLEIFYIANHCLVECPDEKCYNFVNNRNSKKFSFDVLKEDKHICEKCILKIEKNMKYILLDLRLFGINQKKMNPTKTIVICH